MLNISENENKSNSLCINEGEKFCPNNQSFSADSNKLSSPFFSCVQEPRKCHNEQDKKNQFKINNIDSNNKIIDLENNAPILKKLIEKLGKNEVEFKFEKNERNSKIHDQGKFVNLAEKNSFGNFNENLFFKNSGSKSTPENNSEHDGEEELIISHDMCEKIQNSKIINNASDNNLIPLKEKDNSKQSKSSIPNDKIYSSAKSTKNSIPHLELMEIFTQNELYSYIEILVNLSKKNVVLSGPDSNKNTDSLIYNEYKRLKKILEKYDRKFLVSLIFFFYKQKNQENLKYFQENNQVIPNSESIEIIQKSKEEKSNLLIQELNVLANRNPIDNQNSQEKNIVIEQRGSSNINSHSNIKISPTNAIKNTNFMSLKRKSFEGASNLNSFEENIKDEHKTNLNGQIENEDSSLSSQMDSSCQKNYLDSVIEQCKECINNLNYEMFYDKLKNIVDLSKAIAIKQSFEKDTELKLRLFSTEMYNVVFKKTKNHKNGKNLIKSSYKIYKKRKHII